MNSYLVVRLCSDTSFYKPTPFVIGSVEFRAKLCDTTSELKAIEKSKEEFNEIINLEVAPRICTIITADNVYHADQKATVIFNEVLDVMDMSTNYLGRYSLYNTGFVRILNNNKIEPRTQNYLRGKVKKPSLMYHLPTYFFEPLVLSQYLYVTCNDISERLKRSAHWSRTARWESNPQLMLLFRWFSIEATWKYSKDVDIIPVIMLSMGFPTRSFIQRIDQSVISALNTHPRYRIWRKRINDDLVEIRKFRNDTVHLGFRDWDISDSKIKRFNNLLIFSSSRCQGLLIKAYGEQFKDVKDAYSMLPVLFELKGKDNIINDVHGTIIYILENPRN